MTQITDILRPLRIVLPGGSGNIGAVLARYFQERGHRVTVLTRAPYTASWPTVHWDGAHAGPWVETLEGADVCINLSGRSIDCRYTERNRRALYDSRIGPTELLQQVIDGLNNPPWLWMNASSATIYRHAIDREMDEATGEMGGNEWMGEGIWRRRAPEKWNWTARLVREWERALFSAPTPRTRKIALRTSLVMSPAPDSVFGVLSRLTRLSLGGTQGNGRQYVSWIHETDFARALEFLILHEEVEGPVNLTAPQPLPNREFMAALREAWEVPNGLPAPALLLSLGMFLLRSEPELILKSRRVVPGRLLDAGFRFCFPTWPEAAQDLVRRWRTEDRAS
jgi:uncharacterized protein (TIGR01777 family)